MVGISTVLEGFGESDFVVTFGYYGSSKPFIEDFFVFGGIVLELFIYHFMHEVVESELRSDAK